MIGSGPVEIAPGHEHVDQLADGLFVTPRLEGDLLTRGRAGVLDAGEDGEHRSGAGRRRRWPEAVPSIAWA